MADGSRSGLFLAATHGYKGVLVVTVACTEASPPTGTTVLGDDNPGQRPGFGLVPSPVLDSCRSGRSNGKASSVGSHVGAAFHGE